MKNNIEQTAFAPATIANFSCAFDILGFAINNIGDIVKAKIENCNYNGDNNVIIKKIYNNDYLPINANKNTASITVKNLLKLVNINNVQISLEVTKGIPSCSGLGSSAASAVAAIVAVNKLLNTKLTYDNMIPILMQSEQLVSGKNHADNVAPSLMGGLTIIRSYNPLDIIPISCPINIKCAIIYPLNLELPTKYSRKILNSHILLDDAIKQWGNIAALITGILKGDIEIIGKSMQDFIIEPERGTLIPGFYNAKKAAIDNGALGFSICGSGPSVFAIGDNNIDTIGLAIQNEFSKKKIKTKLLISFINNKGAKII